MEQGREVAERIVAWSVVAFVHLLIGTWLARWTTGDAPRDDNDALSVEFLVRRPAELKTAVARRADRPAATGSLRSPQAASADLGATTIGTTRPLASEPRMDAPETGVFDLRVPELAPERVHPDPLHRAPAIDVQRTRFYGAWVPAGNALEQAGFRSKAVGVALSALGGPPRRCSEVERRLREPGCLPLHGQELEDEVLRAEALR